MKPLPNSHNKVLYKSTLSLAFSLIALLVQGVLPGSEAGAAEQAGASNMGTLEQQKEIRAQAELFTRYFSSGQAAAIADLCTEDCTLTDSQGERYAGREAIRRLYENCFRDCGINPAVVNIESLSFPAPDVCIEDGTFFVSKVNSENRYTVVHEKRDGAWKMLRITESLYNPQPSEALKDLRWMIGRWVVHNGDKTITMKVLPVANANFMMMQLWKNGIKEEPDEMQLIGWSFKTRDIVSWHFGLDGGFAFGHWQRTASNWSISTKGTRRDGADTFATYHIDRIDNDHFKWSSVARQAGDDRLPDMQAVVAVREN